LKDADDIAKDFFEQHKGMSYSYAYFACVVSLQATFHSQHAAFSSLVKTGTKFAYECSPISSIDAEKTILERYFSV
jgi:hypothetical protein